MHRNPDGPVVDCSADVQAAAATTTVSERSRVAGKRRTAELIRFERPRARLRRNLGASCVQFRYRCRGSETLRHFRQLVDLAGAVTDPFGRTPIWSSSVRYRLVSGVSFG